MTNLPLDDAALEQVRRCNRMLARLPRLKMVHRSLPMLVQALLRLSQVGADRRLARRGIRAARHTAAASGLRVPVRVLRPPGLVRAVVFDIHGGGWMIGNPCVDDALNAALMEAVDVAVVSVDYRLLPRVPMQGAMDDCLAAARWLLEGGLPEFDGLPMFILGESAGAHLAATVLLRLAAEPGPGPGFDGAVLYYGVYDFGGTPSVHRAGRDTLVLDGPGLAAALSMLTPDYSAAGRRTAPLSPLYGDLAGLPPALLYGGAYDPLRDDTLGLARRWSEVAEVELQVLPEAPHGFIRFPTPQARLAQAHTHAWIARRIAQYEKNVGPRPRETSRIG